jgi:hypothetical protein
MYSATQKWCLSDIRITLSDGFDELGCTLTHNKGAPP